MARQQRLKLTLRDRVGNRVWKHQAITVEADPEDTPALERHVIQMARDLDNRGGGEPWWAEQYAAKVEYVDRSGEDFEVIGGGA